MKNKNILCFVLCIALMLSLMCPVAYASEGVGLSVVSKEVTADMLGFDVQIKVTSNSGIAALGFDVNYDNDILSLTGVTNGNVFDNDDITEGVLTKTPYTVSCMNAKGNRYLTGTLVTLHFEFNSSAIAGKYDITLSNAEAFKHNETEVPVTLKSGSVTVNQITHESLSVTSSKLVIDDTSLTAEAKINITANPGVAVIGFDVEYNKNYFRLTDINEARFKNTLPLTLGDMDKNPYKVLAYNENKNATNTGHFLTLKFDVISYPEGDEYLTLKNAEAFNYDEAPVDVKLINYVKPAVKVEAKVEVEEVVITENKVTFTVEPEPDMEITPTTKVTAVMCGAGDKILDTSIKGTTEELDFSFNEKGNYIKVFVFDTKNLKPLSKPLYLPID